MFKEGSLLALFMLDYLQAFSLLALIITHFFLVRGCFSIKEELPLQGGILAGRLDRTADLLDEVAQLIADLSDGSTANPPVAQVDSPFGVILNALMSRPTMESKHGPKEQEWEIYPNDTNPTTQENDQHHDDGATVPNR